MPETKANQKKIKEELSEDDKILKERIFSLCESIRDQDQNIAQSALNQLADEIKQSTQKMASVPKPYKFLKDHYQELKEHYEQLNQSQFKLNFADFLSVLAMTFDTENKSLNYLLSGNKNSYMDWGFEYLQHISDLIGQEYEKKVENKENTQDLDSIINNLLGYFMQHNSEVVAVDLLMEVDKVDLILKYATNMNYNKIVEYLNSCAMYGVDKQDVNKIFTISYQICMSQNQFASALRLAIKMGNHDQIKQTIQACNDKVILKQLAFDLARQRIPYDFEDEELNKIVSNQLLCQYYEKLAKDLEVSEPKHPDQIYKTFLEDKKSSTHIDSAKGNLANTYVNAFVNVGSGKDSLMLQKKEGDTAWIYKVKNEGIIAATASLGMVYQFDIENGASACSEYMDLTDGFSKQGANIAVGLYSQGVQDENDTAKALLQEQIEGKEECSRLGAIIGLGMAYAGTQRDDLLDVLIPIITDINLSIEVSAFAALSLGLIFPGSLNEDGLSAIVETLFYRSDIDKSASVSRYFAVALGLLCIGQQECCEPTIEAIRTVPHPIAKYCEIFIQGSAYLGSGNVVKIQEMFLLCLDSVEEKENPHKGISVLAMAMIAMQDPIGNEMLLRSLNHILQFGDIQTKRAVPLAIAALSVSDPKITLQDILAKLAYDSDDELAQRSIICLGLIGQGTNNSRLAGVLRQLATYYSLESTSNHLFCVRLAQGFLHTGKVKLYQEKGLMTLQPFYSDRFLQSNAGISGLLVFLNSCFDMEHIINGKYHYVIYYLSLALYPRMMITLDENLENKGVNVRVGQALDTVGVAGQPKRITGFQTNQSPIVLSYGERAELANDEFIPVTDSILENIIILKKNENYVEQPTSKKKS